ncbi:restriction endonuclease subunit S [Lactococcus lactis]|uniref:restriction endonuclease subunit S n=1 Tax=Lactococcus lactis TaxID=1358 RepID=UPI002FE45408
MSKNKKLVPKRRFKEFQNSDAWEQRELGEVVQITMGQSPLGSNYTENPSDYILVQGNADMKNGKVFPRIWTTQVTKTAEPDDIILSVRAPVGDVGKTNYNVVLGRGVAGIKGNEFIYQLLSKMKSDSYWGKYSTGSTFDSINSNDLKEANIFIPSTNEQVQIGSFFRNLDQTIAFQQRKLEKMKAMKSAYLSEMFPAEGERKPKRRFPGFTDDWEQCELGNVADRFDNFRIPITAKDRTLGNTPYYGANGIQDYVEGFTHDGEFVLLAEDGANDLANYPVQYVNGKIWVNNHAHVIAGKTDVLDNKFLMNTLKKINIEPYLVGGGRAKLNSDVMMRLSLKITSIDEQIKIGEFFSNLDQTIAFQQQKLEKLQNIKKAYLNEMFI